MSKPYSKDSVWRALSVHEVRGTLYSASPQPGPKAFKIIVHALDEPMLLTVREAWAFCVGLAVGQASMHDPSDRTNPTQEERPA